MNLITQTVGFLAAVVGTSLMLPMIEDPDNGIISAKAAGCLACGITTTFSEDRLKSAGTEMIVSDFYELAKILF